MFVVVFRTLILYIVIVFGMRLMGKRQLGQLQPNELVITILISNIATWPIEEPTVPITVGIMPILLIVCFEVIASFATLKLPSLRKVVSGNPVVVIQNGQLVQKNLEELRFSVDDLMEELRAFQVFDLREVEFAVVETSGILSVYQKFEHRTVTPKVLGIQGQDTVPLIVISDGRMISTSLEICNLTEKWLRSVLETEGYQIKDVFLMTCDAQADYYIVPKEKVS